jgi:hypothetical protein
MVSITLSDWVSVQEIGFFVCREVQNAGTAKTTDFIGARR